MKIFSGPRIPTPFGSIKMPDLESPPVMLPKMPDDRGRKAIAHGIGQDAADAVIGIIPWVGDILADTIGDMHYAEIRKILTPEELDKFVEYDKMFPTTVALAKIFCFKEV